LQLSPDLSLHAPVDWKAEAKDSRGKPVVTDFHFPDEAIWRRAQQFEHLVFADMPPLYWSPVARGFRSAELVITGRRHAVYAAGVAELSGIKDAQRMARAQAAEYPDLFHSTEWRQVSVPILGQGNSGREDSNLRPPAPKAGALPGCATPRRGCV
jgi:hypothetical protein